MANPTENDDFVYKHASGAEVNIRSTNLASTVNASGLPRVHTPHIILTDSSGNEVTSTDPLPVILYDSSGNELTSTTLTDFTDNLDGAEALNTSSAMFGRIDNDTLAPIKLDGSTQNIQITEHEHAEIHGGDHYYILNSVDLPLNNVRDIRITTPNTTKWGHFTFEIDVESETAWFMHRDAVISTAGTNVPAYNNDENSANTAAITFDLIDNTSVANANSDTDLTGGIELKCGVIGSGKKSLGTSERNREVILKQNTIYNIRLVANSAGNINYDFEFYEHINKN